MPFPAFDSPVKPRPNNDPLAHPCQRVLGMRTRSEPSVLIKSSSTCAFCLVGLPFFSLSYLPVCFSFLFAYSSLGFRSREFEKPIIKMVGKYYRIELVSLRESYFTRLTFSIILIVFELSPPLLIGKSECSIHREY